MSQAVSQPSPPSLASLFLHPHFSSVPHPWTTISWMNLAAAAASGYAFASTPSAVGAMDLSAAASIADLRLKAKRHAEELDAVALPSAVSSKTVTLIKDSSEASSKD